MNNMHREIPESDLAIYFKHPSLLIRVNRLYKEGMSEEALYEITRGLWKVGFETREKARLAFTVYEGVIKEVYSINRWYPAMTIPYKTRNPLNDGGNLDGRWEFDGQIAPKEIRDCYIDLTVKSLFKRGNSNPILKVGFD